MRLSFQQCRSVPPMPPRSHPIWRFAAATLVPAALIALGGLLGGAAAWIGLLTMTLFLTLADRIGRRLWPEGLAPAPADVWTARLLLALGVLHFLILALAIWTLTRSGWTLWSWLAAAFAFGLWFGQVSNPVAHELIHRPWARARTLGMAIYATLLYGHHALAHVTVHHRFAATEDDPNSAPLGEGFWAFLHRAWPGEFIAGAEMERTLRPGPLWRHRYGPPLVLSALTAVLVAVTTGVLGLLVWLMLSAHAQLQHFLSDYVQHYGLVRARTGIDSHAPFGAAHSWDAPDVLSGLLTVHAPRHSDHHLHPATDYPALRLDASVTPMLPWSLPAMATLALFPTAWRRVMDPRVARLARQKSVP